MRGFAQQAEAGGVVVEAAQDDQQPLDDLRGRRHVGPEPHLGVELLLEFLQPARVDRVRGLLAERGVEVN